MGNPGRRMCVCCNAFWVPRQHGARVRSRVHTMGWDGELIYAYICKIDRIDRGRDPNQHRSDEMLPSAPVAWNWELGESGRREQSAKALPGSWARLPAEESALCNWAASESGTGLNLGI